MTKVEYDDPNFDVSAKRRKGRNSLGLIIAIMLLSLIIGSIGGIGGVLLLSSDNGALAKRLGVTDLSIPTTSTEKIVVEESSAIIDATNKVSPSVVSIKTKSTAQNIFGQTYQTEGGGTGFIITNDGLILTNKHVVSDTNASYTVVLASGKTYDAKIQSIDPFRDMAVVKIDAKDLPVVELGDSDSLKVGQWVVAVGNALGQVENSVTAGIISARNRTVEASDSAGANSETLNGLLQTDAAINPGNSGGPLISTDSGLVIGIDTATSGQGQNLSFAIPIDVAKSFITPYVGSL